jgi:hypothetical protein
MEIFQSTPGMRRFDFDSEAVIRLFWRGTHPINIRTPVRYFRRDEGGVSHFKYLRDNLLLTAMYIRLFATLWSGSRARRIMPAHINAGSLPVGHGLTHGSGGDV